MWWVRDLLGRNPHGRPRMLYCRGGRNIEFSGIRWVNSPRMHINIKDIAGMHMHDFEIRVDYMGQLELSKLLVGSDYFTSIF